MSNWLTFSSNSVFPGIERISCNGTWPKSWLLPVGQMTIPGSSSFLASMCLLLGMSTEKPSFFNELRIYIHDSEPSRGQNEVDIETWLLKFC